jgi:hypothetical protein
MSEANAFDSIVDGILRETKEDVVGLWSVYAWVRIDFPDMLPNKAREATLSIVGKVLAEGVVVGGFEGEAFVLWKDQASALERIARDWVDEAYVPTLRDNVWLSAPDLGYQPGPDLI